MSNQSSTSTSLNRGCIGGIMAVSIIVLACIGVIAFIALQHRSSLTVDQWVQAANEGDAASARNEFVCPDSQALRFGELLYARYSKDIQIKIVRIDETEEEVVQVEGNITIRGEESEYEAILHVKNGDVGFLGIMGCVEQIDQLKPNRIPSTFLGG